MLNFFVCSTAVRMDRLTNSLTQTTRDAATWERVLTYADTLDDGRGPQGAKPWVFGG